MKVELQHVLKRELKNRHLTIQALAKSCGIPVSVLHSWVNGVLPSAKNLHYIAALAKCLELPVAVLLFNRDEYRPNTTVLFNSEFGDGEQRYRLSVEKFSKEDKS
jgi:transcriptional regulator with XRE-family HTH domain